MRKQVTSFITTDPKVKPAAPKLGYSAETAYLRMKCPLCDTKRTKPCQHKTS